tara:strand:- start:289 stop:1443 length:1155 start_codon:yes stop_codon:yes gene_type:complete
MKIDVAKVQESILISTFMILSLTGLVNIGDYNFLNATVIFEGLFFLMALLSLFFLRNDYSGYVFQIVFVAFFVVNFILMKMGEPRDIKDFLQAYKAFIYAPFLVFFINAKIISLEKSVSLFGVLLFVFILKYALSLALGFDRPGVYTENNFELGFLMLFYLAVADHLGDKKLIYFVALAVVVALSGSRSAMVALVLLYVFIYLRGVSIKTVIKIIPLIALSLLAIYIFSDRMVGDVYTIDRVKFLEVFIYQISNWEWYNFLFGTYPITPLDAQGCIALQYYKVLFSYSGDGSCYSVVLHSYLLRILFDNGIFGLILLMVFYTWIMRKARLETWKVLAFLSIVFCNSLSVSAVNSVYFSLGIMFLLLSNRWCEKDAASSFVKENK